MASLLPPVISPALKEVAELKIEELNRMKQGFKNRYQGNATIKAAGNDTQKRVAALLSEIKKLDPFLEDDDDLSTITRFVDQAEHDRSVSEAKLLIFEKKLLKKLACRAHRLDVSSLHVELLREYINSNTSPMSVAAKLGNALLDDEFELVEDELEGVYEKFEQTNFMTPDVDVQELESYLDGMFETDENKEAIKQLREDIEEAANDVMDGSVEVEEETIEICLKDLLAKDTVSEEKKRSLQGYLASPQAIRELKSIINMKSLRHWNWKSAERGLSVTARQNSEGKYCIVVEEDIIDMLFLHTLAISWGMKLKEYLTDLVKKPSVWNRNTLPCPEDMLKRDYYLLAKSGRKLPKSTVCTMCHGPQAAPIPPPGFTPMGPPPPMMAMPPPPPPMSPMYSSKKGRRTKYIPAGPSFGANLEEERFRDYASNFFLARLPNRDGNAPEVPSLDSTQADTIKFLYTELRVRQALHDDAHIIKASIPDFASVLPHQTLLTLLKYIGVPELWLDVFKRFLEAPLNMGPLIRGTSDQILPRCNGVPVGHGMELFLGELLMFFLDFAVHQNTGGYLYRIKDECYFVGSAEQCDKAMAQMAAFSEAMALPMDIPESPGLEDVSIGCLTLSSDLAMTINCDLVDAHSRRVKKQLASCTSILDWVNKWNTTMGTYASHLFGPLASVMGTAHLQLVKAAYIRMFDIIFDGHNLTEHVKHLLISHFPQTLRDPPFALEPLIYLPTAYGGLGVKNPFITLDLAHNLLEDPSSEMEEFLSQEKAHYKKAQEHFASLAPNVRARKITNLFEDKQDRIDATFGPNADLTAFMSFEDFTKHRESIPYPFIPAPLFPAPLPVYTPMPNVISTYNSLLEEPIDHVDYSSRLSDNIRELSGVNGKKRWFALSGEDRWVLQMYEDECFERYGGMEIWCGEAVPLEVLRLVRGEEDDGDDGDDEGSVSDVTEV